MSLARSTSVLVLALLAQGPVLAQAAPSFMPGFTAFEGQLKGSEPPAWQLVSMIRIGSEADLNPRGNRLLSALISFVNKRGEAAQSVVLMITAEDKHVELINKLIGSVLEEAATRADAGVVAKLKVSVSVTDPVTKESRSFEFAKRT
ncbi:hypothetical protein [Roseateles paludis]|uniref:DUF4426 domain-containing protein n=1 Tax=Roseateles paludis TaxID=3145238 RepID=A0ABV0G1N8_9BURK